MRSTRSAATAWSEACRGAGDGMCCTNRPGYDDRRLNRARLAERLLAAAMNSLMVGAFLLTIKLLGL